MAFKVVTVLALAHYALVSGHAISEQKVIKYYGELRHIGEKALEHHEEYAPAYPAYEFSYRVEDPHTHDMKGQEESRHGEEVKGQYWLIQPDGLKRTVTYTADKHGGFKAHVEYSDPHHEEIEHKEDKHEEEHKSIVDYKLHHEHKPAAQHIEHKPHVEHKAEHVEHKPHDEQKPHVEHVEHIEHKPHFDYKPHFEQKPIVHQEPHHEHHHEPKEVASIPMLSAYTPRFYKHEEEHYRHPRNFRKYRQ